MISKLSFTCLFSTALFFLALSQNNSRIDSLIKLSSSQKDTVKANTYIELCTEYQKFDIEKLKIYSNKLISIGKYFDDKKYLITGYMKLGRAFYSNSHLDSSLYCYKKALLIAKLEKKSSLIASIHEQLSYVYSKFEMHEKAIKEILSSISIRDSLGDKTYSGRANSRIGSILLESKDYDNAEKYFNHALIDIQKTNNAEALGDLYCRFGVLESDRKNYIKSNSYYVKAILAYGSKSNDFRIGGVNNDLAFNFIALGQFDSAIYFNNIAYQYGIKYDNQILKFSALKNKVTLNLKYLKNNIEAKKQLDTLKSFTELLTISEYKSAYLEEKAAYELITGNVLEGYKALEEYINIKDSTSYVKNISVVQAINAKFETEKKELQIKNQSLEIDSQEKQNKQKSLIILFGTLALVGTGFFAILAFINFRKAKKANAIIENQKQQVELKNEEITLQKELVDEKQKEIIDSINYAKRIQQAVLTGEAVWNKISKEHFILFKPKDIVSGDFYWAYNTPNNRSVFALADCTGHGVPGGFMSMLGNSFLNEIVVENKIFKANEILNKLRTKIINALEQKGGVQQKDGMDISLCVWNKLDNTLEFAGANNPLWILKTIVSSDNQGGSDSYCERTAKKQLLEYKADKMPIGTYLETEIPFSSVTIQLQAGDIIYLSTDGYADQFGGAKGKKLKYKPLMESLIVNSALDMPSQKTKLEDAFNNWKGTNEQVDDVCIIGVRVV